MKRTLSVLISALLVLSMLLSVACDSKGSNETDTTGATETESKTETAAGSDSDTESASKTDAESSETSTESETTVITDSETASKTETETETETEGEKYTDLSGEFTPTINANTSAKLQTKSTGAAMGGNIVITFDGTETTYSFDSFGMSGKHDAYSCNDCKITEKNGSSALYMHTHSSQHIGIAVDLKTPIEASVVSGITITFMTSQEITNESQLRFFKRDETSSSSVINLDGIPDLSGATADWKTVDMNFSSSHIKSMADDDGYIHGFKLMLRDKDATDVYVKSITFKTSVKDLCEVDAIYGNYYGRGDALTAIADKVTANLTAAGIGADLEFRITSYVPSTTTTPGSLTYKVTLKFSEDNEVVYSSITTAIDTIDNIWLPLNDKTYGAERDADEQWKTGFDKSGVIFLSNNTLKAKEGIARVEYSVVGKDADVADQNNVWSAPQILELNNKGIASLYANAALDYSLTEGEEYRFLVRGVTPNSNYILHLDIPFTYSALSTEPAKALDAAMAAIKAANVSCKADENDKADVIKAALEKAIGNKKISVSVKAVADGMLSGKFEVKLAYTGNVKEDRFPSYSVGGKNRSDFFAFKGKIYTTSLSLTYGEQISDIVLTAPLDGQTDIRIASEEIVKFWDTDTQKVISDLYEYKLGEMCDPVPVHLEWTDKGGDGKTYTVNVSETKDFKNAWTYEVTENKLDVYNLKAGQRYYWKVARDGVVSATLTFVTEAKYPRYILSDNVSNFRDLGGKVTLTGEKVKQGLAFRLSNFDNVSSADIDMIVNNLGIKTELDFRSNDTTPSKLGDSVTANRISIQWYAGIFGEGQSEPLRKAISLFAYEENYPIGYHCAIGRDRTGTVSILLLGLLGVDEDIILKEFMVSKNSVSGGGDLVSAPTLYNNYASLINGIKSRFGDKSDTFQGQVEAYLLSIGITEGEIDNIRDILLED